jgi:uncharacterized protein (DUF2141 family)
MRRRGFLQCITLSTVAAILPWRNLSGWQVDGEATSPGAQLLVRVAPHVPQGSTLHVQVRHSRADGQTTSTQHASQAVHADQQVTLVTPYPYADLIAGTYAVELQLHDARGRTLDRHDAGTYTVRRFRFSA